MTKVHKKILNLAPFRDFLLFGTIQYSAEKLLLNRIVTKYQWNKKKCLDLQLKKSLKTRKHRNGWLGHRFLGLDPRVTEDPQYYFLLWESPHSFQYLLFVFGFMLENSSGIWQYFHYSQLMSSLILKNTFLMYGYSDTSPFLHFCLWFDFI